MSTRLSKLSAFLKQEDAVTSVEYAVVLGAMIALVFGAVVLLGTNVLALWQNSVRTILQFFPA